MMFFLNMSFKFIAAVVSVRAMRTLVLGLPATLEVDVAHQVLSSIVGPLTVGALEALGGGVLSAG